MRGFQQKHDLCIPRQERSSDLEKMTLTVAYRSKNSRSRCLGVIVCAEIAEHGSVQKFELGCVPKMPTGRTQACKFISMLVRVQLLSRSLTQQEEEIRITGCRSARE